ncbi:MAG: hypothetical protein ACLFVJ_13485 [Persicimonas sp.]
MSESSSRIEWFDLLVRGLFHLVGVFIVAGATASFFMHEASWQAVDWALESGALLDSLVVDLAVHVGLCALVWAAIVIVFGRLGALLGGGRKNSEGGEDGRLIRLASRRGTVLTETLIVLPVALLLIMGIAQLALVNIAATLGDLAIIQASRSVWVWAPEAQEGRFNVDRSTVKEKARVQAAAILAPAASADFGRFSLAYTPGYTDTFRKTMGAIYGAQIDDTGTDVGMYSQAEAELHLDSGREQIGTEFGFNLSFDSETFERRTARKFFNAWVHTEIEIVETSNRVGAKMVYHQPCLMPLVAGIFGEHKYINGEMGYYVTVNRVFTLRRQVKPNANLPRR